MSKEQILNATGRKIISFEVPQWSFSVSIRSWSVKERLAFVELATDKPSLDLFAKIAIASLCDEQGNLLFTDADLPALLEKDLDALQLIATNAYSHNAIGDQKKT